MHGSVRRGRCGLTDESLESKHICLGGGAARGREESDKNQQETPEVPSPEQRVSATAGLIDLQRIRWDVLILEIVEHPESPQKRFAVR